MQNKNCHQMQNDNLCSVAQRMKSSCGGCRPLASCRVGLSVQTRRLAGDVVTVRTTALE